MSIETFDGDGFADQPSIIYSFEKDDSDEVQIRELACSGFGDCWPLTRQRDGAGDNHI